MMLGSVLFRRKMRFLSPAWLLVALAFAAGCSSGETPDSAEAQVETASEIPRYDGEMARAIRSVYTARKELSLTFNGMADEHTMGELLDALDAYQLKATFFVTGYRVAEEPDIARDIAARGHELQNNTLKNSDLTESDYGQMVRQIGLANDIIERETGTAPSFVRTKFGTYNDDLRLAAAYLGMKGVVSYSLNLREWEEESEDEKYHYIRSYINRGGILSIDLEENSHAVKTIPLIARAAEDVGYAFVPLGELVASGGERLPLEAIAGYDASQANLDYEGEPYQFVYHADRSKPEIALTFDDWGTDYTVTRILDILAEHDVKATFFLRANGVERNPNLARAIVEEGHEVANHTYTHPVITTITPEQLQEEVVKAHRVITEAIQQQPTMLFRPPTGAIDDRSARIVAAAGYPVVTMYDVTTFDWDVSNSAEDIEARVMEQVENGSIVLLHMLDDTHTVDALPTIIQKLKAEGYRFAKVSEMDLVVTESE